MARPQEYWRDVWIDDTDTGQGPVPSFVYWCHNGKKVPTEGKCWLWEGPAAQARANTLLSPGNRPHAALLLLASMDSDGYESELEETFHVAPVPRQPTPLPLSEARELATTICRQQSRADGSAPTEREIIRQAIAEGWDLTAVLDEFLDERGRERWLTPESVYSIDDDIGQVLEVPTEADATATSTPTSVDTADTVLEEPETETAPTTEKPKPFVVTFTPAYLAPGHKTA
jgi:hypothetical protein